MTTINGTTITHTQGDTLDVTLELVVEDQSDPENVQPYEPQEGDSIRFAIKSAYTDDEPIFTVDIPTDTLRLRIESAQTKLLKAQKKPYYYDIELTEADGTVTTFIAEAEWYSTNEVH